MNIFTTMIAEILDVTSSVALRVQSHMENEFNIDWTECTEEELEFTAHAAFEDLNVNVSTTF